MSSWCYRPSSREISNPSLSDKILFYYEFSKWAHFSTQRNRFFVLWSGPKIDFIRFDGNENIHLIKPKKRKMNKTKNLYNICFSFQ